MTLARAAFGEETILKQGLMVLCGTVLIAIAAQISVPFFPVPMTLQTMAVVLVGLAYGARLGVVTVLTYLAQGAAGLPVFANGMNGAAFFGPTTGFLIGFLLIAAIAGFAADRGWTRSVSGASLCSVVASLAVYLPGAAWPMSLASAFGLSGRWVDLSGAQVWSAFAAPFLMGDIVKAVIAALIVTGAMTFLRRRAG